MAPRDIVDKTRVAMEVVEQAKPLAEKWSAYLSGEGKGQLTPTTRGKLNAGTAGIDPMLGLTNTQRLATLGIRTEPHGKVEVPAR